MAELIVVALLILLLWALFRVFIPATISLKKSSFCYKCRVIFNEYLYRRY